MRALGVPRGIWFVAASTLVHYILGAVSQTHIGGEAPGAESDEDREKYLEAASAAWQELDPADYPFMHAISDQMREHDDREQFLTGIALILDGIANRR
ncbi:TetR/AcrR family transcriptional regulator C-terminal domain-containing protein [Nonomuraea endophytica]|uniref:Tetracycline repressor TetR C-terminal domain-containing protein n=1 Tax=Nonomuraea endophytica TaxID=714136 RepID=A0A7W8EK82_9ACTN|nr:TetR/AcrR family transcriptional regulator C-terminal domain-containing protein [Nonomuraea endophytica]MBB5083950.1 hypothetical protein [Nonomuraea endophytica]